MTASIGPVLEDVLARAADADKWERFERQLRSTGYCRRPVRLTGRVDVVDRATGEAVTAYSTENDPDGTLLKCCGNRREAVCPTCARTYRGDAFQLVAAGMRGGKGVPATVARHPLVFLTLTAPSFGAVHSRRLADGKARRCRPRRSGDVCPHGVSLACDQVNDEADPCVGEPMCAACFDHEHAVLWNAMAPELWRRTTIQLARELARLCGVRQSELRMRVSYVKVAEFQRRGVLHFHCVLRLDGVSAGAQVQPPPADCPRELLIEAALAAVRHAVVRSPALEEDGRPAGSASGRAHETRWGRQVEVRPLDTCSAGEAASCAGYIAKYATKSTEVAGGLMHPLTADDVQRLRVRPRVRRYVECAWRLRGCEQLRGLRLRRWAHALGFRGHWFTKSRRYSTTFTALRRARHEHVLRQVRGDRRGDRSSEVRQWTYGGSGLPDAGRRVAGRVGPQRALEERRVAREELRACGASRDEGRR